MRVRVEGTPLVNDPSRTEGVSALGIDETSFTSGTAETRGVYITSLADLDGHTLLDVIAEHSGDGVRRWLASFDHDTESNASEAGLPAWPRRPRVTGMTA